MKDRDIHKLIEQQNPEIKQRMWEKIRAQLDAEPVPLPAPQPKQKVAVKTHAWKWATAVAVLIVVALAVVLPLTLNKDSGTRFCDNNQYTIATFNQTLKEYSAANGEKLLYADWYNESDVTVDYAHMNNDTNDIVFLREMAYYGETDETVTLSVTNNKTRVDIFETYYTQYEEITISNAIVKFNNSGRALSLASFEYKGYIYYLEIDKGDSVARLTEIIEGMLK